MNAPLRERDETVFISLAGHHANYDEVRRIFSAMTGWPMITLGQTYNDDDPALREILFGKGIKFISQLPSFRPSLLGHSSANEDMAGLSLIIDGTHRVLRNMAIPIFRELGRRNPHIALLNEDFSYKEQAHELASLALKILHPEPDGSVMDRRFTGMKAGGDYLGVLCTDIDVLIKKMGSSRLGGNYDDLAATLTSVKKAILQRSAETEGIVTTHITELEGQFRASLKTMMDTTAQIESFETQVSVIDTQGRVQRINVTIPNYPLVANSRNAEFPLLTMIWALAAAGDSQMGRSGEDEINRIIGGPADDAGDSMRNMQNAFYDRVNLQRSGLNQDLLVVDPLRLKFAELSDRYRNQLLFFATSPQIAGEHRVIAATLLDWAGYSIVANQTGGYNLASSPARQDFEREQDIARAAAAFKESIEKANANTSTAETSPAAAIQNIDQESGKNTSGSSRGVSNDIKDAQQPQYYSTPAFSVDRDGSDNGHGLTTQGIMKPMPSSRHLPRLP